MVSLISIGFPYDYHEITLWFVVWNVFNFPIQLGMSSSHLLFIFFRGVGQPPISYVSHYQVGSLIQLPMNKEQQFSYGFHVVFIDYP